LPEFSDELRFAGQLLLGGAFAYAGLRNVRNRGALGDAMSARGVPWPVKALWLGIVLQTAAGALLMAGVWTRAATVALLAFLLAAMPMFHNFWDHRGPEQASRLNGFVSSVALAGSLLVILSQGG
jgi:putative oxidoreductase